MLNRFQAQLNHAFPHSLLRAPDDGGNPGGGQDPPKDDGKGGTPNPVDFDAFLKTQPKEVQDAHAAHVRGLKTALDAERKAAADHAAKAAELERLKKVQDDEALAKQGEYKTLAEQRATKVAELEQAQAAMTKQIEEATKAREAAETAIAAQVDAMVKELNLPKPVLDLLEGKTALEKQQWLTANAGEFKKPGATFPPAPNNNGGGDTLTEEQRRARAAKTW